MRLAAAALLALLFSGCTFSQPKKINPLSVQPVFPSLVLAVVPTQNTKNTLEFARRENESNVKAVLRLYTGHAAEIQIQALPKRQPVETLLMQLRLYFKSVVSAETVEDARALGAPLLAQVDVFESFPTTSSMGNPTGDIGIDETVLFTDASGATVEKISASDKERIGKPPIFYGESPTHIAFVLAHDAVMSQFEKALTASEALRKFAAKAAAATSPSGSFPGLAVAIVPSENTRRAVDRALAGTYVRNLDLMKPILSFMGQLRANFKTVASAPSLEEAKKFGADVVAVADFFEAFTPMQTRFKISESVLFLDADGNRLDAVSAKADESVWENGRFSPSAVPITVAAAEDSARKRLQAALDASQPLRDYARLKGGAGTAAAKRSDVDEPRYRSAEDPAKLAVVIGVEGYESLPAADYAERDAQAMRRHLLALGYPDRRVILLTGKKAGKADLEKYLESWLPANVSENSEVFVYFSGHGAPDVKSGQVYLMPWDADAKFVDSTGYPVKRLYERLNGLKARKIVVALDSCFSGAGGRSVLAKGARPLVTRVDAGLGASGRLVVLAAASGAEITGADDGQGHGLFTYYLLKGLNERGGTAPVRSLFEFLKPKVQDAARRDNRDQTPQLLSSGDGSADKL